MMFICEFMMKTKIGRFIYPIFILACCFCQMQISLAESNNTGNFEKKSEIDFNQHNLYLDQLSYPRWLSLHGNNSGGEDSSIVKREGRINEKIGKIIQCYGECRVQSGPSSFFPRELSSLFEGDEVLTSKNAHIWIFLLDGSLLRIFPQSSVSFNEINISQTSIGLNLRLNYGYAYFKAAGELNKNIANENEDEKETDQLFLPLKLLKTTPSEASNASVCHQRKKSRLIISTPQATFYGDEAEFFLATALGGKTYIKNNRDGLQYILRGFEKYESGTMPQQQWHVIDHLGMSFKELERASLQIASEFVVKRIKSIEKLQKNFLTQSLPLFCRDIVFDVGKVASGYRIWSDREYLEREILLLDYYRRIETTNLYSFKNLKEKMLNEGKKFDVLESDFSGQYFNQALNAYFYSQK